MLITSHRFMAIKRLLNNSISISINPLKRADVHPDRHTRSFADCVSQGTVQEIEWITLNSLTCTNALSLLEKYTVTQSTLVNEGFKAILVQSA